MGFIAPPPQRLFFKMFTKIYNMRGSRGGGGSGGPDPPWNLQSLMSEMKKLAIFHIVGPTLPEKFSGSAPVHVIEGFENADRNKF